MATFLSSISEAERAQIVADHLSGFSIKWISKTRKRCTRTIISILDLSGIQRLRKPGSGNRATTARNSSRHARIHQCDKMRRQCVIWDLPGSCAACKAQHSVELIHGGASSGWTTEAVGAGR